MDDEEKPATKVLQSNGGNRRNRGHINTSSTYMITLIPLEHT